MRIGIVTGACSGLGRAYARQIDKTMKLDELWLVARREDRLNRLAEDGGSREKAEAGLLGEENFKEWYESLMREMAGRTDG